MAEIQGKRSVKNKQSAVSIQHLDKARSKAKKAQSTHNNQSKPERSRRRLRSQNNKNAYRRVFHFPQTHGKLVEDVEFSTCPDYHNVSINFQDETCLNFSLETGFTLETDYSDWKTGNQRVIRAWKPVRGKE